jgi:hypothetical protein
MSGQLSAMPSVHGGWAVLVAIAVIRIGTTRGVARPCPPDVTLLVGAATANHWWLDERRRWSPSLGVVAREPSTRLAGTIQVRVDPRARATRSPGGGIRRASASDPSASDVRDR